MPGSADEKRWRGTPDDAHTTRGAALLHSIRSSRHDDPGIYAIRSLNQPLIRRLVVLKLWQAGDTFDPALLMRKFEEGKEFDWDDLRDLVRRTEEIDRERICAACVGGFGFLADLSPDERMLANDTHQREHELWDRLRTELASS